MCWLAVVGCGVFDGQRGPTSARRPEISGFPHPTGETAVPLAWVSATHEPAEPPDTDVNVEAVPPDRPQTTGVAGLRCRPGGPA